MYDLLKGLGIFVNQKSKMEKYLKMIILHLNHLKVNLAEMFYGYSPLQNVFFCAIAAHCFNTGPYGKINGFFWLSLR